ncbi:MAG: hypothetical protein AB7F43_06700 [Bacteriovoracia bacterium]
MRSSKKLFGIFFITLLTFSAQEANSSSINCQRLVKKVDRAEDSISFLTDLVETKDLSNVVVHVSNQENPSHLKQMALSDLTPERVNELGDNFQIISVNGPLKTKFPPQDILLRDNPQAQTEFDEAFKEISWMFPNSKEKDPKVFFSFQAYSGRRSNIAWLFPKKDVYLIEVPQEKNPYDEVQFFVEGSLSQLRELITSPWIRSGYFPVDANYKKALRERSGIQIGDRILSIMSERQKRELFESSPESVVQWEVSFSDANYDKLAPELSETSKALRALNKEEDLPKDALKLLQISLVTHGLLVEKARYIDKKQKVGIVVRIKGKLKDAIKGLNSQKVYPNHIQEYRTLRQKIFGK